MVLPSCPHASPIHLVSILLKNGRVKASPLRFRAYILQISSQLPPMETENSGLGNNSSKVQCHLSC